MPVHDASSLDLVEPTQLPEQLRTAIEAAREESERTADIPTALHAQLAQAGSFRLLTPREYGGYETSLTTALDVYEGFGRIDASVGLLVWNANFGFLAAFLPPVGVATVWAGKQEPIFANSSMPGRAEQVEAGYRVSGHWKIVSGIHAAQWFVAVGIVESGGRSSESEAHDVRAFLLHRDELRVATTWDVSGMRGTGSNDVFADGVFVPAELVVRLDQPPHIDRPPYRGYLPALVFPGASAVCIGVAHSAIEEVVRLATTKTTIRGGVLAESGRVQYAIANSQAEVSAARLLLRSAAGSLQSAAEDGREVTIKQRAALRAAMTHAAQVSRRTLVTMYELASSAALYRNNPIERIHRDGMAALQHANHSAQYLEAAGRVRLGLSHDMPLF